MLEKEKLWGQRRGCQELGVRWKEWARGSKRELFGWWNVLCLPHFKRSVATAGLQLPSWTVQVFMCWSVRYTVLLESKLQNNAHDVISLYKERREHTRYTLFICCIYILKGLPWWLSGKESACQCRSLDLIPESGRRKWQPTAVFLPGKF